MLREVATSNFTKDKTPTADFDAIIKRKLGVHHQRAVEAHARLRGFAANVKLRAALRDGRADFFAAGHANIHRALVAQSGFAVGNGKHRVVGFIDEHAHRAGARLRGLMRHGKAARVQLGQFQTERGQFVLVTKGQFICADFDVIAVGEQRGRGHTMAVKQNTVGAIEVFDLEMQTILGPHPGMHARHGEIREAHFVARLAPDFDFRTRQFHFGEQRAVFANSQSRHEFVKS